jgi:hypothetical protein
MPAPHERLEAWEAAHAPTPDAWSDLDALRDRAGKLTWGLYRAARE